jgi:hypothetical protein
LVEVPVSTVRAPELLVAPVPVALPVVKLKAAEAVEGAAVLAVCKRGACKLVAK